MSSVIERNVVLELPLLLKRLLRHVATGSDGQVWEGQSGNIAVCRNQVVPILITDGQGVHDVRRENGSQRCVRDDELIGGEIVSRQIGCRTVLVIQTAVGL